MRPGYLVWIALLALPKYGVAQIDHSHWLPTFYIKFLLGSSKLSDSAKRELSRVSERMLNMPTFKVVIEGKRSKNKSDQLRNRARVNAALNYLLDSGNTDRVRFMVKYEGYAPSGQVVIRMPYGYDYEYYDTRDKKSP